MPRHTQEHKQFYKSKIRSLIAVDHGISRLQIQKQLDDDGLHLDLHYVGKLYNEIFAERAHRLDRRLLNQTFSAFEDTMTEIVRVAWEIANTKYIEKKLGSLDLTVRNAPLPEEKKQQIREVFTQWGLLPAPKEDAGTTDAPAS
jgi:hypothetical protein